jgi:hypothetical protein
MTIIAVSLQPSLLVMLNQCTPWGASAGFARLQNGLGLVGFLYNPVMDLVLPSHINNIVSLPASGKGSTLTGTRTIDVSLQPLGKVAITMYFI